MTPEQFAAGARTVTGLAAHFEGLKGSALCLLEGFGASQRGYFTPLEDEETRHLLVSYWQSRNALFELVLQFRHDYEHGDADRSRAFLVGYAGALVLVDAARFIRDHCHQRPVVRAKLNEPEPHFGIPAGTYEVIQQSLTSPVHAWHLYHAAKYFQEHRSELDPLAIDPLAAALLGLIDLLEERIRIDLKLYATTRVRVRTRQFSNLVRRDLLSRALYGLQKAMSRLASNVKTVPGHRPALPVAVAAQLRVLLQPGDVLITRKEHALTNYFLPGYWPHAALYLGDARQLTELGIATHQNVVPRWSRLHDVASQEPRRVLEALKDGVWIRPLDAPLACDAILVLRPRLAEPDIAAALARGLFHDGKPYDFDFDFTRSDRLVCTEVIYRSYESIGGISFPLTRRAGRLTLAAEDLIDMALDHTHFDIAAGYSSASGSELVSAADAECAVRTIRALRAEGRA